MRKPASREMISASVELCDPTDWNERVTSENTEFLLMLTWSLQGLLQKSES